LKEEESMTLKRDTLRLACCAVAVLFMATAARADFITAYGWITTEALVTYGGTGGSAATLADPTCSHGVATCTPADADVSFTTTGIGFGASTATIQTWLASSAFPVNGLTASASTLATLMDATIWEFSGNGSFTSPQAFTITHDDGATFVVNGQTVVDAPGPTAPVATPGVYTGGAGGSLPFDLVYAECCGGPAVIATDLVGPSSAPGVPEPAGVALLGTALLGLAVFGRKLRKA
jgi:hypothetical protein